MPRISNNECDRCGKAYYQRPSQALASSSSYCSRRCYALAKTRHAACLECDSKFNPKKRSQKFCSVPCAIKGRKKRCENGSSVLTRTDGRLALLKREFDFDCCMVDGCHYSSTYDVHRLRPGRAGGKYEIGNMFAICPNHHAEEHRGITKLEKINDCSLRAVDSR